MIISSSQSRETRSDYARRATSSGLTSVDRPQPQALSSGREGASISTNLSAMSTNASVHRVLSDVMGPRTEGTGNFAADALVASMASLAEPPSNGSSSAGPATAAGAASEIPAPSATTADPPDAASQPSQLPPNVQNLMLYGGDRKKAVETLMASGAKAENPDLPWYKDAFRALGLGGDKKASKDISAEQTIYSNVRARNFNLLDLRLTSKGTSPEGHETRRHIDLETDGMGDGGWTAQVKDAGKVIAKGSPNRMFEQDIKSAPRGQTSEIDNTYIDPKTGFPFMRTNERSNWIETDKMGQVKSHKDASTYRQIDMLGADGKVNQRYVFDYANKSIRLESLDGDGAVTSAQPLSKGTDYWAVVDRLSLAPPSSRPPAPPSPAAVPAAEAPVESPAPA